MAETVPLHLAGNNAPVAAEVTLEPSKVTGEIPAELSGQFFRNGPNPRTGWSPHSFAGDGMIHTIALDGGRARWYRNRYVRTPLYEHPGESRFALAFDPETGRIDYRVTTANTHLIAHAGRLFTLEEGGFPYEVTPELATIGAYTFDGRLETPMTAHPKTCPITGELLFFGYRLRPPYLTYYRADAAGTVVQRRVIDVPRATMMHDFAVTRDHVVFLDLPVVFDAAGAAAGGPPWRWDDAHRARFGVLPRTAGDDTPVRWFDVAPCYVWHTMNAFDDPDAGTITVTGTRVPWLWRGGPEDVGGGLPALHRWTLDLRAGTVAEGPLDDTPSEYPRVADAVIGLPHRYGYTTAFSLDPEPERSEIYAYDLAGGGVRAVHRLPRGHTCGEAVFVAREGATAENDGYLMTFAHDRASDRSYLAILDAADLAAPPLAEVHVPVRVPAGFHGNWVPMG
ncbi:carotenoid cleavage dioxygenase [Thermocatellispora tengchongensis]|uniref:Dioxygenase n=1 Tax=Thermocatellispora tengchongensis TaxID=1073253 RepID=A0A840P7W1_9ACTN|nr:carotenoid oxygenase family protein [Thermocatellispora tengchongensis]MBB5134686.1 carotenoid cleavage dioxygenase [Thermocatellispora tengchongensis]